MNTLSFLRSNTRWLAAGALLTFLSSFGQTFFISLFAGKIQADFGLSHGQWGGIYTLGTGVSAAVMVWAGALTDHYRVRSLGAVILVLLAMACAFMAMNNMVWLLPLVIFALRFTGQGMTSHIAVVAMSRWFVAARGRALSVATLGFSVGEAILPLIFVSLMVLVDWRILWLASGVIALFGIPVLTLLLRQERTPQSLAKSDQSAGMKARHWTRLEVVQHPLFWFMIPALLGPSAFNTAFFFHQVHFADIKSLSHVQLVAMFPFYTIVSIAAMVASGWGLDRVGTPRLIPWFLLPMVIAFTIFAYAGGWLAMLIGFFFLALTTGANATLISAFWAEFYGTRHIGSIKALGAAIMVLGSAIGPGVTGLGIDLGLGIEAQYLMIAAFFAVATVLLWAGVHRFAPSLPPRSA